jgi:hypothetical protein
MEGKWAECWAALSAASWVSTRAGRSVAYLEHCSAELMVGAWASLTAVQLENWMAAWKESSLGEQKVEHWARHWAVCLAAMMDVEKVERLALQKAGLWAGQKAQWRAA